MCVCVCTCKHVCVCVCKLHACARVCVCEHEGESQWAVNVCACLCISPDARVTERKHLPCAPVDGIEFQNALCCTLNVARCVRMLQGSPAPRWMASSSKTRMRPTPSRRRQKGLPTVAKPAPHAVARLAHPVGRWRVALCALNCSAGRVHSPWNTLQLLRRRRGCARHSERRNSAS